MNLLARDIFGAALLTAAFLSVMLAIELAAPTRGPVLVVANPFSTRSALQVIVDQGGDLMAAGAGGWVAVGRDAVGKDAGDGRFRKALAAQGMLLLRAPRAALCQGSEKRAVRS